MSRSERMVIPVSSSASMRFGVITAARGRMRVISDSMASSRSRREPLVEIMTGSTIGSRHLPAGMFARFFAEQ